MAALSLAAIFVFTLPAKINTHFLGFLIRSRWHSFKRSRKTWLRGARCLEDLNNFWMAHKPQTMSELYSHLHEELEMRLEEAEPKTVVAPNAPKYPTRNRG
jgi:hypothetical protein